MSSAIKEGFEKSLKGNYNAMKPKIEAFIEIFSKDEIKEGDVFLLDYVPNVGLKSFKNGKLLATTEGEDFKKGLFGIWLGPDPVDSGLKTSILGNKKINHSTKLNYDHLNLERNYPLSNSGFFIELY